MQDQEKHFDEDPKLEVSDEFSADIKALFEPDISVPPEVDRAIMDRAYQKLIHRRKNRRIFRWSACAAAAAMVIFVFMLDTAREPQPEAFHKVALRSAGITTKTDIDQNGRVNILDAFQLARHIESNRQLDMKWDINGDGSVNRDDVDSVAFVAVRLDKGVL